MKKIAAVFCLVQIVSTFSIATFAADENGSLTQDPKTSGWVQREASAVDDKVKKAIASAKIELNGKTSLSILDGAKLNLALGRTVEPSYLSGPDSAYLRVDQIKLSPKIDVGDLVQGIERPIYAEVDNETGVIYTRPYATQKEALLAPLHPQELIKKIPLTAKNALNLEPSEMMIIPIQLNVYVGARTDVPGTTFTTPLVPMLDAHYLLSGAFRLQVLALPKKGSVRVRLIAERNQGGALSATLGNNLKVYSLSSLAEKEVNHVIGTSIAGISVSDMQQGLFMADYIFDLTNPDAAKAYNELLSPDIFFKNFSTLRPGMSLQHMGKIYVSDLQQVDNIVAADRALPIEQRRIIGVFQGTDLGNEKQKQFTIGSNFFGFKSTRLQSANNTVELVDSTGEVKNFLIPYYIRQSQLNLAFFHSRHRDDARVADLILPNDASQADYELGSFVVNVQSKRGNIDTRLMQSYSQLFRRGLPLSLRDHLVDDEGQPASLESVFASSGFENTRISYQVIIADPAFRILSALSREELSEKYDAYAHDNAADLPWSDLKAENSNVSEMLDHVYFALHQPDIHSRVKSFIDPELQSKRTFRDVGVGFLLSMLPQDVPQLQSLVRLSIRFDAKNLSTPVVRQFGASNIEESVKVVQYMQYIFAKGMFDVRRETFGNIDLSGHGSVFSIQDLAQKEGNQSAHVH